MTKNRIHYDISTKLDEKIIFIPEFIFVYLGCFAFWALVYSVIIVCEDRENAKKFTIAEILGKSICFITYIIFPTTMVRATVPDEGISNHLVKFVYNIDAADLLFPSIHCYVSWMCFIGIRKMKLISKKVKVIVLIGAILICISTLAVKQHVIYDVIVGVVLADGVSKIMCRKE